LPDSPIARYDSWDDVMAALELSAATALDPEAVTDDAAHVAWTPPAGLGPLPLHLRERALHLLAEQRESVRAVPQMSDRQSVYLDVTG
jgi:hypothetical protein